MPTLEQVNQLAAEVVKRRKLRKVIDYMEVPNSACRNCKYRKDIYGGNPPKECRECGFEKQRKAPYFLVIPVYEDDEFNS